MYTILRTTIIDHDFAAHRFPNLVLFQQFSFPSAASGLQNNYRSPTKLREGNVFIHVLSVHRDPSAQALSSPSGYGTSETPQPQTPSRHGTPGSLVLSSLLVTSDGHHWRPAKTSSIQQPEPLLTFSGEYVRSPQAGSTHPIGMISCFK